MKTFSTIAIWSKPSGVLTEHVQKVIQIVRHSGAEVLLDANSVRHLGASCKIAAANEQTLLEQAQAVITIGGDGTMIGCARTFAQRSTPIIGVNAGRLGFITDIAIDEIDRVLPQMLAGHYIVDTRPMLEGTLYRDGKPVFSSIATNDVGICHGRALGMVEYALFVDDKPMAVQRADGIIVSTATGSTAYAMSAGGPIMHPAVHSMLLVPIAPHTLSNRPILVHSSSHVTIEVNETRSAVASFDAQVFFDVAVGDKLKIGISPSSRFVMLHPEGFDQYELLRRKLHWSFLPSNTQPIHDKEY